MIDSDAMRADCKRVETSNAAHLFIHEPQITHRLAAHVRTLLAERDEREKRYGLLLADAKALTEAGLESAEREKRYAGLVKAAKRARDWMCLTTFANKEPIEIARELWDALAALTPNQETNG
jgi:hypothetical protein